MINQTLPTGLNAHKQAAYGLRLKSAREALGIDRKDIAAQLRLHESMITMIEHGEYKTDIPMTFIRGYIRGYSKLLGIPDKEIHDAMELMKPKPEINEDETSPVTANQIYIAGAGSVTDYFPALDIGNVFMRLFTCLLALTLVALVAAWWHSHKVSPHNAQATSINFPSPESSAPSAVTENSTPDYSSLATEPKAAATPETTPPVLPAIKTQPTSHLAGKDTAAHIVNLHPGTELLRMFTLFLLMATISMRLYTIPTRAGMASLRANKAALKFTSQPFFKFDSIHKLKLKPILISITIILCGLSGSWWYKHNHVHITTAAIKQPVIKTEQPSLSNELLTTDFATLASPATLTAFYLANITPYILQDWTNQLDQYIADAAATKFALTSRSTPIGQFNRKKYRKNRQNYYLNVNSYGNNNSIQQPFNNSSNAAPPYYTVQ